MPLIEMSMVGLDSLISAPSQFDSLFHFLFFLIFFIFLSFLIQYCWFKYFIQTFLWFFIWYVCHVLPELWLFNPMRTTCRLVDLRNINILWFIEPTREVVRENSLMQVLMLHFESFIIIGLTNKYFMIWTNRNSCQKAGSAQGVKNLWIM